jgi:hypothetical protein
VGSWFRALGGDVELAGEGDDNAIRRNSRVVVKWVLMQRGGVEVSDVAVVLFVGLLSLLSTKDTIAKVTALNSSQGSKDLPLLISLT